MFGYFSDGPRTWKWAVPASLFILLIPVTGKLATSSDSNLQYWSVLPCGFAGLALATALVNLWKMITAHNEEVFAEHQAALSLTPVVLIAQSMRQMHPEAIRVLERFGVRTSWQVRVAASKGTRTWVLEGTDPNVHFGFIEFVLSHSGKSLYPKRSFAQGSKKWDPDGLVEDRAQHEEFEKWLFSRLMVTRSHGEFKSAEFIPPWTPEGVMEIMGINVEQEILYQPDDETRKELPVEKTKELAIMKPVEKKVLDLTDEESAAIETEMARYANQYSS